MMKRFSLLASTFFLLMLLPLATHAQSPGWSRGQQLLPISYDECVKRAAQALGSEGYDVEYSQGAFAVGRKGVHTGVIMCNAAPEGKQWVNIVVASNGEGGGSERERLQARMESSTRTPPPPPTTGGGREGCQQKMYAISVQPQSVRPGQQMNIRFASQGRVHDYDWIGIYPVGKDAHSYVTWAYATAHLDTCSWTLNAPSEPGEYEIGYLLDNGYDPPTARTRLVVGGGSSTPPPPQSSGECKGVPGTWRSEGGQLTCYCTAEATRGGSVWGSDIYTDDSNICRAAVHAGVIGSDGGTVTIRSMGAHDSYSSTTRNGVTTTSYGGWPGSFAFIH